MLVQDSFVFKSYADNYSFEYYTTIINALDLIFFHSENVIFLVKHMQKRNNRSRSDSLDRIS